MAKALSYLRTVGPYNFISNEEEAIDKLISFHKKNKDKIDNKKSIKALQKEMKLMVNQNTTLKFINGSLIKEVETLKNDKIVLFLAKIRKILFKYIF